MSKWIGYAVSVKCAEPLGCYQGTIIQADYTTITLTKAFRNGYPYPKSRVTLKAADIKDIKIIEEAPAVAEQSKSTVTISSKKPQRNTVCENLQANATSTTSSGSRMALTAGGLSSSKGPSQRSSGQGVARSKPIEIQANKNNTHLPGSYGGGSTPRVRGVGGNAGERARRRNEAAFGVQADSSTHEFDFEGNLALFDKQALWEQMRSQKPDLVRHAGVGGREEGGTYRHDENIIVGNGAARGIRVPDDLRGPLDYVTDEGLVVPSVRNTVRRQLWEGIARQGLCDVAHSLLARATADVALRLVGGTRRLDPRNAHQAPTVVSVVGAHRTGATAVCATRLLAAHGVKTAVHVVGQGYNTTLCSVLQRELSALQLTPDAKVVSTLEALPSPDLLLVALCDLQLDESPDKYTAALSYVRGVRSGVVLVEPRGGSGAAGWEVAARASVCALLPPALPAAMGRLYLAQVAPPDTLFQELHIAYRPPFGGLSVLALHPADG